MPPTPPEIRDASLDEAYAIRRAFQEIEETTGRGAIAGYKIGLTTPVMQRLCGVDEPCYGAIFAREVHHRRAELSGRLARACAFALLLLLLALAFRFFAS